MVRQSIVVWLNNILERYCIQKEPQYFVGQAQFSKKKSRKEKLTLSAVGSVVSRLALALAQDALPVTGAAFRAVPGQLGGDACREGQFLGLAVVVVETHKPVASLQVVAHCPGQRLLKDEGLGFI